MASERRERMAENEAMFRVANERMADWEEQHASSAVEPYFCECANPECGEHVDLRKAEYERVRSDSRRFVIVPGHEVPDVETVGLPLVAQAFFSARGRNHECQARTREG